MYEQSKKQLPFYIFVGMGVLLLIISLFFGIGYFEKNYKVWAQRKEGEAELARAESNRKIKTLEAKAMEESAQHLANAEIIRARGVAQANEIIGKSLENAENYLKYLWITGLEQKNKEVIYVPTEANLPILEAGKR